MFVPQQDACRSWQKVCASAGRMAEGKVSAEVKACIAAFKAGKPVMVFDSAFREGETDLLWAASSATPAVMRQLRKDCGGLLFLAVGDDVGERFGLPYLQDMNSDAGLQKKYPVLKALETSDLQYDTRSAFTLSMNHRETFTGITDRDRALTTRRFAELFAELEASKASPEASRDALGAEFRTPGHIPLCREAPGGLKKRRGHTELSVSIARLAGVSPVVIGAEMLQPDGDAALSVEDARKYAKLHGIPMVTGADLVEAHGMPRPNEEEEAKKKLAKRQRTESASK
jgi:3,4-dihydroxy 2-butanone 4-phosphate synthase